MTARPPTSGLTATHGTRRRDERRADLLDREDRPDAHVRVGGRDHDRVGGGQGLEHAGRGLRIAHEANAVDLVAVAAGDEPLLERKAAGRRVDPGAQPVVRRRQDRGLDPEGLCESRRDRRERLSRTQSLAAHEVEPEIAVAEPEPVLPAERGDGAERFPRLARPAPAAFLVVQPGERVEDAVEVGRDGETEDVQVVADVADHGHVARIDRADEAAREARPADAAGEERDLHRGQPAECRLRARPRAKADPLQVVHRVHVVAEIRDHGRDGHHALGVEVLAKAVGAALAVQRGEEGGAGKHERVRRPVLRLYEPDRIQLGRAGQRAKVVRHDTRNIRVDDDHRPVGCSLEPGGDRRALTASRIVDRLGAELLRQRAGRRIVGDDEGPPGRDARGENVAQHRQRELRPHRLRRIEALLAGRAAEGDDDLRHGKDSRRGERRHSPSDWKPSRRCSTSPGRATTPCAPTAGRPS